MQVIYDLVEVTMSVVDNRPSEPPTWEAIDLWNWIDALKVLYYKMIGLNLKARIFKTAETYNNRNIWRNLCQREIFSSIFISKSVIHLIGNYRNFKFISYFENLSEVFLAEIWSTRIRWIIDQDSFCSLVNLTTHWIKVNFPTTFRLKKSIRTNNILQVNRRIWD